MNRERHTLPAILLLSLITVSCSSDTMPKYSIIQGLRVLALILDCPEVDYDGTNFTPPPACSPGGAHQVSLTPVISDLYGGGRSLSYRVTTCMDPGVGLGAIPTCEGSATKMLMDSNTISTHGPNQVIAPSYTGSIDPIAIDLAQIPASPSISSIYSASFQALTPDRVYNGSAILVFFELYPTGDESKKITTFKRLVYSGASKTTKNLNPASLNFKINGSTITTLPGTETRIDAEVPSSSLESYSAMVSGGTLTPETEAIETQWFLTGPEDIKCSKKKECTPDGLLDLSRTVPGELNLFHPPEVPLPTGRDRILIGVAKDNRGGMRIQRICDRNGTACP